MACCTFVTVNETARCRNTRFTQRRSPEQNQSQPSKCNGVTGNGLSRNYHSACLKLELGGQSFDSSLQCLEVRRNTAVHILLIEFLHSVSSSLAVGLQCTVVVPKRRQTRVHSNGLTPIVMASVGLPETMIKIGFDVMKRRQEICEDHPVEIRCGRRLEKGYKRKILSRFIEVLCEGRHLPSFRKAIAGRP
jgi:hypothetical protein